MRTHNSLHIIHALFTLSAALTFLPTCTESATCPKYICHVRPITPSAKAVCALVNRTTSTYSLYSCPPSTPTCMTSFATGDAAAFCSAPAKPILLPGDACQQDGDCLLDNCTQGVCLGLSKGDGCLSDAYCKVGLGCWMNDSASNTTCQELIGAQGKCAGGKKCLPGYLCDTVTNNCTSLYSLPDKTSTSNSDLCVSGFAATLGTGKMECHAGPLLKTYNGSVDSAVPCASVINCIYTYSDQSVSTNLDPDKYGCFCGVNEFGFSYCRPGAGDSDFQLSFANIKKYIDQGVNCHIGYGLFCSQMKDQAHYANAYMGYLYINHYELYVNNTECAKEIYPNYLYWDIVNEGGNVHDSSVQSQINALLLGLIFCLVTNM